STRDLNALTDLDTSAASKDMATDRNRRNDRWICREASEVPMVFRTKNPAAVMVLGVISSEGHVMPPHFFEPKQKVNQEVYLEVLSNYTFQQDSAPAHKAKTVQAWLKENVPHFWDPQTWPSNSPDLNPCDYYLPVRPTTTLWRPLSRPSRLSGRAFRSRVETVVEAGGGHIE
ncbi:Transposable element tcb2 transposase, partial [Caligus rogercresseyi]